MIGNITPTWKGDVKVDKFSSPIFVHKLAMPDAKDFKDEMEVAVIFKVQKPYYVIGSANPRPSTRNPYERKLIYNHLIGELLCAVVTDGNGVVVKRIHRAE